MDKEDAIEYLERNLSKKEKNDYDFRCVFHFTKKPETGCLNVEFI